MPESERIALVDGCFSYDDVLRKGGHFTGGEALQPPGSAVTLRFRNVFRPFLVRIDGVDA